MKRCIYLIVLLFVLGTAIADTSAQQRGRNKGPGRRPPDKGPKVGDMAPTFNLMSPDGKEKTDLEKYRGKKPLVLFFGSYS